MPHADVIVVGGGAIGCAAAYALASEGLSVSLLERGDVAAEASGVAAGMLTPVGEVAHSETLFRHGIDALADFPALCERAREGSGIDPEFERSGALRIATSEAECAALRSLAERFAVERPELSLEWLDPAQAESLEPGSSPGPFGALWSPQEAHVRSVSFTKSLAAAASALGAQIESGVSVHGLVVSRGAAGGSGRGDAVTGVRCGDGERSAGFVLLCCGPWAAELAGDASGFDPLPIRPVRGQLVSLEASQPLRHIVWGGETYLVPKRDGTLLVGATEEHVGYDKRVTAEGVNQLLARAPRLVPALARAAFRGAQVGLRPGSPDGLPAIAPAPGLRGLAIAAGHFRNGILLAPTTGRLLAEIVLGKANREALADFDPRRWRS